MNEIITKFDFSRGNWDALMDSLAEANEKVNGEYAFKDKAEIIVSDEAYRKLQHADQNGVKKIFPDGGDFILYVPCKLQIKVTHDFNLPNDEMHWVIKD